MPGGEAEVRIAVASGKGGTGKTSIAVNLALSIGAAQLLDCDVEAPNVHLLLHPRGVESKPIYVKVPRIIEDRCNYCGRCAEACNFNAIFVARDQIILFEELCHGCGLCAKICPQKAIVEEEKVVGFVKWGWAGDMKLIWGELGIGEPSPEPVIEAVKSRMDEGGTVIIDVAPGTSCPVVSAVYGSDFCILVTEPTPFGLHDLKQMVGVLRRLDIPMAVVINKAGLGDRGVYEYCEDEGIPILMEIPFDRRIAELYSRGIPFVQEMPEWRMRFQELVEAVRGMMG